jgi:ribonuclease HII
MKNSISINELEAMNFAKLIDSLDSKPSRIFLDSPDVISERFGVRISMFSGKPMSIKGIKKKSTGESIKIISEHKADSRYPVVSCASIIAKVERDSEIEEIKEKLGINIGSGYPSDKYTMGAIKDMLGTEKLNPYVREYWSTMKGIRQMRISDFVGV